MGAPKGNQYWKFRNKHGRNFAYTPESLWEEAVKYFEWISEKVWNKNEAIKSGNNAGKIIKVPTQTPMSIESFCLFADINRTTLLSYESNEDPYKDFHTVVICIKNIIASQQFEGATVGAYNPNIIARKLGLADKKEVNNINPASIPLVLKDGKTYEDLKNELKPE